MEAQVLSLALELIYAATVHLAFPTRCPNDLPCPRTSLVAAASPGHHQPVATPGPIQLSVFGHSETTLIYRGEGRAGAHWPVNIV